MHSNILHLSRKICLGLSLLLATLGALSAQVAVPDSLPFDVAPDDTEGPDWEVLESLKGEEPLEEEEDVEKVPGPNDFLELEREPQLLNQQELVKLIGRPGVAATEYGLGRVMVRVLVDREGNYVKHILLRKVHPDLDQAVIDHVPACKFSPAIQAGKPVMCWVTLPFAF